MPLSSYTSYNFPRTAPFLHSTSAYCTFSLSIGSTSLAFCNSVIGLYECLLKTLALDNVPTLSHFVLAVENLHNSLQGKPCEGSGILQAQELDARPAWPRAEQVTGGRGVVSRPLALGLFSSGKRDSTLLSQHGCDGR